VGPRNPTPPPGRAVFSSAFTNRRSVLFSVRDHA
jgi:hypothetical protein